MCLSTRWFIRPVVTLAQLRLLSSSVRVVQIFHSQKCMKIIRLPQFSPQRHKSHHSETKRKISVFLYFTTFGIVMIGLAYAGVPLYKIFCQATGFGGQAKVVGHDTSKIESMSPVQERIIKVKFNADTASSMMWSFKPQQPEIKVCPGETALAFYTATNPTDKPIIGIATYNILPFEAGKYFNKIQCFCFEEQRLNAHEQVDMPVFFYLDPDFDLDPLMKTVETITLSYTFFVAKEGLNLPLPGYLQSNQIPH